MIDLNKPRDNLYCSVGCYFAFAFVAETMTVNWFTGFAMFWLGLGACVCLAFAAANYLNGS